MIEQQGLLNYSQAGLLLDVSPKRIRELVMLGKLSRFAYLDHNYVSMSEVTARRDMDLKAGRPRRSILQRVVLGFKAAAETDMPQLKQGGFAGPYEKHKAKSKGKKPTKKP